MLFPIVLACGLLAACVTETKRVDQPSQGRDREGLPQEVLRVPQQMQDLAGELLRYHAGHNTLPATLEVLLDERLLSPQQFADLPDYAYHPLGLGQLRDGRAVILVDSEVRIEGHAWCIVREPSGAPRSIQLNVTPIALSELEAAARQAQ
ncbi:MAG: hypothetical protein ACE37H_12195 [Phycisphaeraceae bacterium]